MTKKLPILTKPLQSVISDMPKGASLTEVGIALCEDLTFDQWNEIGLTLVRGATSMQWWWADWWIYSDRRYGERAAIVDADNWEGPSFSQLMTLGSIARAFETSRRRKFLSFSHHRETAGLKAETADELLDWCEETVAESGKPPTIRELREKVRGITEQERLAKMSEEQRARQQADIESNRVMAEATAKLMEQARGPATAMAAGLSDKSGPFPVISQYPATDNLLIGRTIEAFASRVAPSPPMVGQAPLSGAPVQSQIDENNALYAAADIPPDTGDDDPDQDRLSRLLGIDKERARLLVQDFARNAGIRKPLSELSDPHIVSLIYPDNAEMINAMPRKDRAFEAVSCLVNMLDSPFFIRFVNLITTPTGTVIGEFGEALIAELERQEDLLIARRRKEAGVTTTSFITPEATEAMKRERQ
jgi:hypothetical protein